MGMCAHPTWGHVSMLSCFWLETCTHSGTSTYWASKTPLFDHLFLFNLQLLVVLPLPSVLKTRLQMLLVLTGRKHWLLMLKELSLKWEFKIRTQLLGCQESSIHASYLYFPLEHCSESEVFWFSVCVLLALCTTTSLWVQMAAFGVAHLTRQHLPGVSVPQNELASPSWCWPSLGSLQCELLLHQMSQSSLNSRLLQALLQPGIDVKLSRHIVWITPTWKYMKATGSQHFPFYIKWGYDHVKEHSKTYKLLTGDSGTEGLSDAKKARHENNYIWIKGLLFLCSALLWPLLPSSLLLLHSLSFWRREKSILELWLLCGNEMLYESTLWPSPGHAVAIGKKAHFSSCFTRTEEAWASWPLKLPFQGWTHPSQHENEYWRMSTLPFSFCCSLLTTSHIPLLNLSWLRLLDAAEIPWESSNFFRSTATCALRHTLDINRLFLTLSIRLCQTHGSRFKANKTHWNTEPSPLSGFLFVSLLWMVFACFLITSAQGVGVLRC